MKHQPELCAFFMDLGVQFSDLVLDYQAQLRRDWYRDELERQLLS